MTCTRSGDLTEGFCTTRWGGEGVYFWNFTIVKLRPDRDKENERVESCPRDTGNQQNIVHSRIKHRDIDELGWTLMSAFFLFFLDSHCDLAWPPRVRFSSSRSPFTISIWPGLGIRTAIVFQPKKYACCAEQLQNTITFDKNRASVPPRHLTRIYHWVWTQVTIGAKVLLVYVLFFSAIFLLFI